MKHRVFALGLSVAIVLGSFSFAFISKHGEEKVAYALSAPAKTYTNGDADTYYSGISDELTGDDLLAALRSLNKSKRKSTVGYSAMGTSPTGLFRYTDFDLDNVAYDENNQPYGTKLTSFYSGNSAVGGMNREHVWPQSHGGKAIEADIHMPRPTIQSENGSRGNSFYVEGMKDTKYGWDPAAESFGEESYRGDSARIIFYCAMANASYSLVELNYHDTSNSNPDYLMGRLSHMVKWNLNYAPADREMRRNEGAEYLQGNRNPFIDHPEYVCRIWGDANDETRALCAGQVKKAITIKSNGSTVDSAEISIGKSQSFEGYVDSVKQDEITWSLENEDETEYTGSNVELSVSNGVATVTSIDDEEVYLKAAYSYEEEIVTKRIKITSYHIPVVESVELTTPPTKLDYYVGESINRYGMVVTASLSDGSTTNVASNVTLTPSTFTEVGEITVSVTYEEFEAGSFTVNVTEEPVQTRVLSYIQKVSEPTKKEYNIGDTFDPTGLRVEAHYNDSSVVEDVTDLVTFDVTTFQYSSEAYPIVISYTENGVTSIARIRVKVNGSTPSNGCGGNIATTSIVLASISLAGIACIVIATTIRKKKNEK